MNETGSLSTIPNSVVVSPPRLARKDPDIGPAGKKKRGRPPTRAQEIITEEPATTTMTQAQAAGDGLASDATATGRLSRMGRTQQASRLVRERETQEKETADQKRAQEKAKALRKKAAAARRQGSNANVKGGDANVKGKGKAVTKKS